MIMTDTGLPFQVGIASRTPGIGLAEVAKTVAALNLQISRDFAPIWGISASIVALPNPDLIDPGIWPIFIEADIGVDAAGFHFTKHNQPFARVAAGATWSLTASHECLEMLADPTGNRLYSSVGVAVDGEGFVDRGDAKFEYLIEVCDPCQDPSCAYLINDVMVADFYTPRYFDPVASAAVRYSFSGKITRPRQVVAGGYLTWADPRTGGFQQARWFERPEIVDVPLDTGDSRIPTLRGAVDRLTPAPNLSSVGSHTPLALAQDTRQNWLGTAAAARASLYAMARRPLPAPVATPDLSRLVTEHAATLEKDGVISVRPGWLLSNGWPTSSRAVVVIAEPAKLAIVRSALPATLGDVPVDVRAANPQQAFRHAQPAAYAALASGPRQEYAVPSFPGELRFGSDDQIPQVLEATRQTKQHLPYALPEGVELGDFTEQMTLTLHASPDAGWAVLRPFLELRDPALVAGMYDFTSPHVEASLLTGRAEGALTLTLDHPPGKKTREQTIDTTRLDLDPLGPRLTFAWALEGHDPKVSAFVYPNAYHIKVAVRSDGKVWLSSGNWNTSNQPVIDLANRDGAIATAKVSDRDWHVLADSPTLAQVFRAILQADCALAAQHQREAAPAGLAATSDDEVPPELLDVDEGEAPDTATFFPPQTVSGRLRVRPLLTPNDYQPAILDLINGARSRFWMQTQYIKPSGRPGDEAHDALIAAVAARIADGVDVKLITSTYQTADLVEKLMDAGIDQRVLRLQARVHNKGIIVDDHTVVVSSQNWSADGTLRNRDAGLIIYDCPEAAAYFERIFLHDWAHLARQRVTG